MILRSDGEVDKGGTQWHPLATLVGQPRSGAQVLVQSTKTLSGWLLPTPQATFWALGVN